MSKPSEPEQEIVFNQNVDCPECGTVFDQDFKTGALDEDGLADVTELSTQATCPNCGEKFEADYSGWLSYGSA